ETWGAQNPIQMDCRFFNTRDELTAEEALGLFGEHLS
ncbi:redox-regulated molecular chaperone Hsp33, partial [Acinetobacter baumannii]